jgi:hypothetical protein
VFFLKQLKPEKLNPEIRGCRSDGSRMRISMDRSNDKAKTSEKNGNMSGRPIWLANSVLGNQCHVCAFFSNRNEEYQVLIPFENETRRLQWLNQGHPLTRATPKDQRTD